MLPQTWKLRGSFNANTLKKLLVHKRKLFELLDASTLYICSHEDERNCLKLAEAGPALSRLRTSHPAASAYRQFAPSFLHVSEKLLLSSCETLEEFAMELTSNTSHRFISSRCPALPQLKKIFIYSYTKEHVNYELLDFLGSINHPKLLSSLFTVPLDSLHEDRKKWESKAKQAAENKSGNVQVPLQLECFSPPTGVWYCCTTSYSAMLFLRVPAIQNRVDQPLLLGALAAAGTAIWTAYIGPWQ